MPATSAPCPSPAPTWPCCPPGQPGLDAAPPWPPWPCLLPSFPCCPPHLRRPGLAAPLASQAGSLLQQYKKEYEALVEAMARGAPMMECIRILEA